MAKAIQDKTGGSPPQKGSPPLSSRQQRRIPKGRRNINRNRNKDNTSRKYDKEENKQQKNIEICLQNTRSILGDKQGAVLEDFIEATGHDIYAITETWFPTEADGDDKSFGPLVHNYERIGSNSRKEKTGGGVSWYVKRGLINDIEVKDSGLTHNENVQLSHITFRGIHLVCVYIRPDMHPGDHETVFRYIAGLEKYKAIILGDFNLPKIDFINGTAKSARANEILEFYMHNTNYCQLINEPTHEKGGILDLVFTSDESLISETTVKKSASLYGWDHFPIQIELANSARDDKDEYITYRPLKKVNWNVFQTELLKATWPKNSLEEIADSIETNIITAIETAAPLKKMRRKQYEREKHLSQDTIDAIETAYILHKQFENCQSLNIKQKFRNVVALKNSLKERDHKRHAEITFKNNPTAFWNHATRKNEKQTGIPTLVEGGEKVEDDQEKANILKNHLLTVYEPREDFDGPYLDSETKPEDRMPDIIFTDEITKKAVLSMKTRAAPGEDGISALLLKKALPAITEHLTELFQLSYEQGKWPKSWLRSIIIPLHKKGSRRDKANYRPISLMRTVAKVMEKVIKFQLTDWYKAGDRWEKFQHAFTANRSTASCLLEQSALVDEWLEDKNVQYVGYCAIDKKKAFDKASFKELGKTMVSEGMPEKLIKWQMHGLQNREFRVRVGNGLSQTGKPTSGIQQGSCLSPYLWIQHMQSLGRKIKAIKETDGRITLYIYADDVVFVFKVIRSEDEDLFQKVLDTYSEEAKKKALFIHPDKSQILKVGNNRSERTFTIEDKKVPEVNKLNVLGVWLNNKGDSSTHFEAVRRKIKSRVFHARKTIKTKDIQIKTVIWDAIMGSVLRYGRLALKEFSQSQLNSIQALQHLWMKDAKVCKDECPFRLNPNNTCEKHAGPLPVYQTLCTEDIAGYRDIVFGNMDVNIELPQTTTHREKTTRSNTDGGRLIPPKFLRPIKEKSFMNRVTMQINALPPEIRSILVQMTETARNKRDPGWKGLQKVRGSFSPKNSRTHTLSDRAKNRPSTPEKPVNKRAEQLYAVNMTKNPILSRARLRKIIRTKSIFKQEIVEPAYTWRPKRVAEKIKKIHCKLSFAPSLNGISYNSPARTRVPDEKLRKIINQHGRKMAR